MRKALPYDTSIKSAERILDFISKQPQMQTDSQKLKKELPGAGTVNIRAANFLEYIKLLDSPKRGIYRISEVGKAYIFNKESKKDILKFSILSTEYRRVLKSIANRYKDDEVSIDDVKRIFAGEGLLPENKSGRLTNSIIYSFANACKWAGIADYTRGRGTGDKGSRIRLLLDSEKLIIFANINVK